MLATFLPRSRRLALANKVQIPERAAGVCLFADIAGFTSLAENLRTHLGPQRGAEIVASLINEIFSGLIKQVHSYGGDVMGFAGDAITCWFAEPDAS
jgi:class 3 adenylate cyclase